MSGISNSAIERAEARVVAEIASGIGCVAKSINTIGSLHCIDCDVAIGEARRLAAPFAKRCIDCQKLQEKFGNK